MDVPVLVAGAGPVGLTLACELERLGVAHRIVDAAPRRAALSRATDLHARTLELWDHTGVAESILAAALPITGVPLFSAGREVARLDFAGVDSAFPAAVSLPQSDLEALFATALRVRVFVIADRPPAAPPGVEAFADPALRAHGRLGAVCRAAYVVRPDGHLGFRCEPPDAAWLTERLSAIGIRVPAPGAAR